MKQGKINFFKLVTLLLGIVLVLQNCQNDEENISPLNIENINNLNLKTVSFQEAQSFFELKNEEEKEKRKFYAKGTNELALELIPDWGSVKHKELYDINQLKLTTADVKVNREGDYTSKLFFINHDNKIKGIIFTIYQEEVAEDGKIIKATMYFNKLNGEFFDGYKIENGRITKRIVVKKGVNIQKAGFMMFFQSKQDCWNEDNLPDDGMLEEVDLGTFSGGGGGTTTGTSVDLNITSVNWYYLGNGDSEGTNYSGGGTSVDSGAGTLYVNNVKQLAEDEEQIINLLPEKGKCVFNKLQSLNLFKATIKKFENSESYDLILQSGNNCENASAEACTDASDLENGNITINFQSLGNNNLGLAASILHEGIHAEIYKYVDEHKKGIDPNNRPNVLYYYNYFKAQNALDQGTTYAQHEHMQDKYVIPIAQAIRKLDNYKYPLEEYLGFGWDGLKVYKYDTYLDAKGKEQTMTPEMLDKITKKSYNIAASSNFGLDCK
jgi:uncharacterized protein YkuJ